MGVVIVHDEMGVYLGSCIGLGFWTLLDPAGQPSACVFDDPSEARDHIRAWQDGSSPGGYRFVEVDAARYATIPQLKAAGLAHLLGEMEADALRYAEPEGTA